MHTNDRTSVGYPPVAIIGMGCFFPCATGFKAYWQLLYHGKDAIGEVPPTHWSPEDFYDEDPRKPDHVCCRRGGFLSPIPFDPTVFGIPPSNIEATDTSQLLGLLAAKTALDQAGYGEQAAFDREHTAVILGVTGTQELVIPLSSRLSWPQWKRALENAGVGEEQTRQVMERLADSYVGWQENSFPGLLGNVVAGRICNRLNLGGTNCVVDAACASSMSAVNLALMELYTGKSRMVVTGGVDTLNDIFMHMCFARTQILSPTGDARPFSRRADGTVLGEGIGILIMKRLEDAEADGDRILALLKGIGSSSDGKSQGIYAPRAEGQLKALRQAYESAGVAPETLGLFEAHGTGTRVGDKIEIQALTQLFDAAEGPPRCALGSVKSMIGHTKAAAGAAGLIKAVLALQNKVLPPTLKVEEVDPDLPLDQTPFFLNDRSRPWFRVGETPRRAGVSAFGFGGSNFHAVLEEYHSRREDVAWDGSVEIVALSESSPQKLQDALQSARKTLVESPPEEIPYLARSHRAAFDPQAPHRLLLVITRDEDVRGSRWDIAAVFDDAAKTFATNTGAEGWQTRTAFYGSGPRPGKLAFLFPGQGSQYPHMARDLVAWFPEALETLEAASGHYAGDTPLPDLIYPLPGGARTDRDKEEALRHTAAAQPAIGAVSTAMEKILRRFGVVPEATCGHSYGELTALCSAGWIDEDTLHRLSALRGRLMADAGGGEGGSGAMLAVKAPLEQLDRLLEDEELDVVLANRNSPNQGVLSGESEAIDHAESVCKAHKFRTVRLPVAAAFHSRLVEKARAPFADALLSETFRPGDIPVYSNTTAAPYPSEQEAIRKLLGNHLRNPVDFIGDIASLYRDDHRIFVEVGPKSVLTGLVRAILKGRDFQALSMDAGAGKTFGVLDLAKLLSHLAALGCPIDWTRWETREDPPPPLKMRVPLTGANRRNAKPAGNIPSPRATRTAMHAEANAQQAATRVASKPAAGALQKTTPAASAPAPPTPSTGAPAPAKQPKSECHPVNQSDPTILQALQVVQQGLQSLQALQAQTVEAHQKFLETQQQASQTLQEMMASSRRFAEAAFGTGADHALDAGRTDPPAITAVPTPVAAGQTARAAASSSASALPPAPPFPAAPAALEAEMRPEAQGSSGDPAVQTLLQVVSDLTGYPTDMLAMDMHIESDLGIDSIKRVEILSQLEERGPSLPPLAPDRVAEFQTLGDVAAYLREGSTPLPAAPAAEAKPDAGPSAGVAPTASATVLLEVVSELTGYPADMLSLDMDVEADLGIDSIKRVEILSALEDRVTDFPAVAPEEMAELKTLGQIADRLRMPPDRDTTQAPPPSSSPPATTENVSEPVEAALLTVVSELTGYPAEMLSADMDIEADLGIDSIKRVEILSAMEDRLAATPPVAPDELAGLKTLGQIAAALSGADPAVDSETPHTPTAQPAEDPPPISEDAGITRRILIPAEAPRPDGPPLKLPHGRKIFITTDKSGLSHALADQLSAQGLSTVQISVDILKHRADLPEAAGLILLCDAEETGPDAGTRLKSFLVDAFALTRHLGPSLRASAAQGGAFLAAVSRLDGTFGMEGLQGCHPYQGGLAGLIKTAALEWPEVACRVLDVDARWQDNPAAARDVVTELLQATSSATTEIGLGRDRRVMLALQPEPLTTPAENPLTLEDGDVVVISGGARGVTAAAAEALARQRALTLILLGRSPQPFDEPDWLSAVHGEAGLKKAIATHEFAAARPTPQAIEDAYRRYTGNREIRDNLARIAAAGADVRYISLDIRESERVQAVINDIRLVHGPIKALVHGAGILRDRLIADKTPDEFRQVFDTKVEGLENLLVATGEDPLHYIVLFSSVAARFGNVGQADYAVANEVLNKVAAALAERRPESRVRSINWGPWDGGMVTPALKKVFAAKQIALIPPERGAEAFIAELTAPATSGVEVVIGSELPAALPLAAAEVAAPIAMRAPKNDQGLSTTFISELNLEHYPILDHHRLDGKPVVPFALMAEWFGHGALHNHPGLRLAGLDDMRLLKGIVLDGRQRPIRVLAGAAQSGPNGIAVNLELRDGMAAGTEVIHSRATALLVDHLPDPPSFAIPDELRREDYERGIDTIYGDILFHGTALQGLHRVKACNASGMVAELATAPDPGIWIHTPPRNRWIADPLVLDGAFQMASLWCYEQRGQVSLPSYSAAYRQYCRRFPSGPVQAVLVVQSASGHKLVGDFTFLDQDGKVLADIKGYEAVMEDRLMRAFKPERFAAAR